MTARADWLAWALPRSVLRPDGVVSEITVATRAWMLAGNPPPTPAASDWTLAAAALVAA